MTNFRPLLPFFCLLAMALAACSGGQRLNPAGPSFAADATAPEATPSNPIYWAPSAIHVFQGHEAAIARLLVYVKASFRFVRTCNKSVGYVLARTSRMGRYSRWEYEFSAKTGFKSTCTFVAKINPAPGTATLNISVNH